MPMLFWLEHDLPKQAQSRPLSVSALAAVKESVKRCVRASLLGGGGGVAMANRWPWWVCALGDAAIGTGCFHADWACLFLG